LKERYKKRYQKHSEYNNRPKEDAIIKSHDGRKAIPLFSILTKGIKERYAMSQEERRNMSTLVKASILLRKYRLAAYTKNLLGFTDQQMHDTNQKRKPTLKPLRLKQKVSGFYERNDNSRNNAYKNQMWY